MFSTQDPNLRGHAWAESTMNQQVIHMTSSSITMMSGSTHGHQHPPTLSPALNPPDLQPPPTLSPAVNRPSTLARTGAARTPSKRWPKPLHRLIRANTWDNNFCRRAKLLPCCRWGLVPGVVGGWLVGGAWWVAGWWRGQGMNQAMTSREKFNKITPGRQAGE